MSTQIGGIGEQKVRIYASYKRFKKHTHEKTLVDLCMEGQ